jgi:class 3 adenylate cyclase
VKEQEPLKPKIKLKKIFNRNDLRSFIDGLVEAIGTSVKVYDSNKNLLFQREFPEESDPSPVYERHPIICLDYEIGYIEGGKQIASLASILTYISQMEYEKKTLAAETLERYKEITLMYDIAEKISEHLSPESIAEFVIEEAKRLIKADNLSVMLLNENTGNLEIIAAEGTEVFPQLILKPGRGIAGNIFLTGKAEIVNNVPTDPRYITSHIKISSMLCVPLRIKEKVLGIINLSSREPSEYRSSDLRLLSVIASQAASAIENAVLHEKRLEEEKLKATLQRYIAPQVVNAIVNSKEDSALTPKKCNISVLFADIRNFTPICEQLEPEKVVSYLNEYFSYMVEIIFKKGGTLNKFVGDMIVALFGAPAVVYSNEIRAIEAAIEMQNRLKNLPNRWISANFKTGIGISSGDVVVGNIGSPQHMDYTAIGDEVNTASRLQALARGGQILVTENIYQAAKDRFGLRYTGTVQVKGKRKNVKVYEVSY